MHGLLLLSFLGLGSKHPLAHFLHLPNPSPSNSPLNLKYSLRWISSPSFFSQYLHVYFHSYSPPSHPASPWSLFPGPLPSHPIPDKKISYKISFFCHTFPTSTRMPSDSFPFHWKGWLLGLIILVVGGTWNEKYEYSPLLPEPESQSPVSSSTNSLMGAGLGVGGKEGDKKEEKRCVAIV